MKIYNKIKLARALKKRLAKKQRKKKPYFLPKNDYSLPKAKELFRKNIEASHPAYIRIRDGKDESEVAARALCEKLWTNFEPYSDQHFLDEFARDFDARFWEMDLTVAFLEDGHKITCPKPGPDVCIEDNRKIWVEAIAPKAGNGTDKVPPMKFGEAQTVPNDQIILRYTSAIVDKFERYKRYLASEIISGDDSYIIAINGCQIPCARFDHEPPRIVRSVFPFGDEYITIDKSTGETREIGFEFRASITKHSGSEIPIDLFLQKEFAGISAVIFSCTDCCNRPVEGNDWIVVHNPLAINPIRHGIFPCFKEYHVTESETGEYILNVSQSNT